MLEIEEHPDATVFRMNHGKVHALDIELLDELARAFRDRASDPRPVVLTGAGDTFCAGVDLRRVIQGGGEYVRLFLPRLSATFLAVFEHPAPVVAAVNGHAIAGGCVLVTACDVRVGLRGSTRYGVTELLVGLPYPTSAVEILRHALGEATAANLIYTGRLVDADEAHRLGVLDILVDDPSQVLDTALQMSGLLGAMRHAPYRLAKHQLRREALERIANRRIADDERVEALWAAPEAISAISDYMDSLKRARGAPQRLSHRAGPAQAGEGLGPRR